MKKLLLFLIPILVLSIWFMHSKTKVPSTLVFPNGGEEESEIRKQQEWQMLKDPATNKIPAGFRIQELQYLRNNFPKGNDKTDSDTDWVQRGPWNVGGRTRAMAIDVTNDNNILAASVSGGLYRSTDGGETWNFAWGLLDHQGIVSIAQDKRVGKQNIWYAMGGEASGSSESANGAYFLGDGMFKSIDSGKTWSPVSATATGFPTSYSVPYQTCWRIASSPRTDIDVLYVCAIYGILRSSDGGNSWNWVLGSFSNPSNYYSDIDISTNGAVYASVSSEKAPSGVFRATNDSNFVNISPTQYINNYNRIVLDINPNNENEVYFFVHMDDSVGNPGAVLTTNYKGAPEYIALLKYTYISGDGTGAGGQWTNLSANLPTTSGGPFDKLNCQGSYDMTIKVQPITNYIFIGGTNLYYSKDAFATANNVKMIGGYKPTTTLPFFEIYPFHHPDQHDVCFTNDTAVVWSASDGGVRKTTNIHTLPFVTWENKNGGYFTSQYYTVNIDKATANDPYLLGGFQDNGNFITNTFDLKHQWQMPVNGDGAYNYIAPNRNFYVMSIQLGKMVKCSLDNAGALLGFKRIDPIGPNPETDYLFINPFEVDPNDNNYLYLAAGKYLYRQSQLTSLPFDGHYDSISTGWTKFTDSIASPATKITAVAVSKAPANIVYYGTDNKKIYKITNANGANPTRQDITSAIFPTAYISCIAVDQKNANNIAVTFSNYNVHSIFISFDGGTTWNPAGGNLESSQLAGIAPSVRWLSMVDEVGGSKKYYCGTSIGLFSSDSLRGGTGLSKQTIWKREGINTIGNAIVTNITWREIDGYVVAGTHGRGAFANKNIWPLNTHNVTENRVLKIYPNPTTEILKIEIPQDVSSESVLKIFNCFGQLVLLKNIDNKSLLNLDVSTLNAGNYIISLFYSSGVISSKFTKL